MVETRSEFERSWASVERKPDEEKREGTNEQESLHRQVDVLDKKLEIYRSREAALRNELLVMREEEEKKENTLQDLKQNNQLLVKKVLEQEKKLQLMRGRLKDNREKSINLSKEIFSLKQKKGFDDKSKKLREENHALKKELIRIRAEHVVKIDQIGDCEDPGQPKLNSKTNRSQQTENSRIRMEALKWQLWASHQADDDTNGAKVKWTEVRSTFGEADFVTFQNEVEGVCQELQEKTCLIQKLRMDLRRRELEFSNSFSNSIAKVKEETADTIVRLQAQVEGKELIESSNAELRSRITSMQRDQESLVSRHDVEQVRKDEHIHALEKTIETQKQAIKNMNEKIHELRNQKEKLSDEKLEVAQDLQLQIGALRAKEETLDKTVIELTGIVESQKVDYLAQVQSLQLMIEELEREGPLSRAIEALEKTEIMAGVRLRVGDLKARNQRLQQENLKLAFHMDATSLKLKKMETRKEDTKELKAEFARMKEELDLFQSPKFDDVQNENIMLRERLKFIDKELRQDERYCLVEEANEWYKQSSVGPKITSLSFSTLSGGCDNLIAEDKKSTPQNCNTVKDVMVKESSKQNQGSIDEDKWL